MSWRTRGPLFISFHTDGRAKVAQDDVSAVAVWTAVQQSLSRKQIYTIKHENNTKDGQNKKKKWDPSGIDSEDDNLYQ